MTNPTAQEVFDITLDHLRKQGKPSYKHIKAKSGYEYPSCLYRAEDGNKCAVGVHIEDHLYHAAMEGNNVATLLIEFDNSRVPEWFKTHLGLLSVMQTVHDDVFVSWDEKGFNEAGERGMKVIALDHNLIYKEKPNEN